MVKVPYPFPNLTRAQRGAFEAIAVGDDRFVAGRAVDTLVKLGLVEVTYERVGEDRFGVIQVPRYHVPIPHHIVWCAWCAAQYPDDVEALT